MEKKKLFDITITIFRDAPFLVSPARHGEAQDVSGTWNKQNKTHTKNKKGAFRGYTKAPVTVKNVNN